MILKFPDLDTLRLAMIAGAVPPSVSGAPARADFSATGPVLVEPGLAVARGPLAELRKLGVASVRSSDDLGVTVSCWAELLPLSADPVPVQRLEQTPVLFDLPAGAGLPRLILEILRLGNDRITYRWLESQQGDRALLRVVGPPYYALLRAIDRIGGDEAPTAYIERHPRVWVQVGYRHPLAEHLTPPAGKILLLQAPRHWEQVPDAPFTDIYSILEFPLPDDPVHFDEGSLAERIDVRPTLRAGGSPDGAELWVLRDNPIADLNRFVQNADDQLLQRLNFAVGSTGKQTTIVLRIRQSKLPPPALVLPAIGYKPYLKLANLFLPVGTRLHPPIRRDVVRKLLADDPDHVVWLHPSNDAGGFLPESLPEGSFRPLWDWVDYILDREQHALAAWTQAATFDFEGFICDDEQSKRPKKPGDDKESGKRRGDNDALIEPSTRPDIEFVKGSRPRAVDEEDSFGGLAVEPSELRHRLRALEENFLSMEGGLDIADRLSLWPEMAELNAALDNAEDGGICWLNALWQHDSLPVDWCWRWFRTEAQAITIRLEGQRQPNTWVTQATSGAVKNVSGADLDRLLAVDDPSTADLRALAAYIVYASQIAPISPALLERLNILQGFLEKHEKKLPVRAAWLAWSRLVRLSRVDVLALARTRDRLLERLFHSGLRPEQDLPAFLRFAGQPTNLRFRAVRQWMLRLVELAHTWVGKIEPMSPKQKGPMAAYVNLTFAFGLARLGEQDAARELLHKAHQQLTDEGEVHHFLFSAYEYRIKQSIEGKVHTGPLPIEQLEYLEQMDREPRYAVDRLRQRSRILEPNEQVDPYRNWGAAITDLDRPLARLSDMHDRKAIIDHVRALLNGTRGKVREWEERERILRSSLEVAPRVGEEFARELLDQVPATWDALAAAVDILTLKDRARFLEKALSVAAHFGLVEQVQVFLTRFHKMLASQSGEKAVEALEALAGQCFRGLRKLGMRDEIDQLLTQMAEQILEGRDVRDLDLSAPTAPAVVRALLHVAGGWYYFGRDRQAEPIMLAARNLLLNEDLTGRDLEKTKLACTYAVTLGQAPVEVAQKRLEEVFVSGTPSKDRKTTERHYNLWAIDVIEAVVHAVASDDFTMGTNARRWLDDDEFLVRRRIHRDWEEAKKQG